MSAVERAVRDSLAASLCEALYHAFPGGDHHDNQPCAYCTNRVSNALAAVRAERDAAWREESLRVAKDEILTVTSAYNVVGVSIFNKAINAALAALAARMEAKG